MTSEANTHEIPSQSAESMRRLRGLRAVVEDAVEHGSSAVERIHLSTADIPFNVLQRVPGLEAPVRQIRAVHDEAVRSSYRVVRLINRAVARSLDVVLEVVGRGQQAGDTRTPSAS